jgi:hypothetical protein
MRTIDAPLLRVAVPFFFWLACAIFIILVVLFPFFLGGTFYEGRSISALIPFAFCELLSLRWVWADGLQLRFWRRVGRLRQKYRREDHKEFSVTERSSLLVPLELKSRWNSLLSLIFYIIIAPIVIAGLIIFVFVYHGSLFNFVLILLTLLIVIGIIAYMYGSSPVLNAFYQRVYVDDEGITVTVFLRKPVHLVWSEANVFMGYYPYEPGGIRRTHKGAEWLAHALYELSSERQTVYWNWRPFAEPMSLRVLALPAPYKSNAAQFVEQFNLFVMEKTGLPLHELDTADVVAKPAPA